MINKPLSASRIKVLQTCSWLYHAKYILRIPDPANEGSLRGSICHTIFEVLGNPRHKKHYKSILKASNLEASKPIYRMVLSFAKKNKIDDFENLDLINRMALEGLKYDFFSKKHGKAQESISEKHFDVTVCEGRKNYRVLGFIDKLFLFKKEGVALIRDFKTTKKVFSGDEIDDNLQNLIYCLAVKHLYPEYMRRDMEFLFLKFDCGGEGLVSMEDVSEKELEGFEMFLTEMQKIINNFDEKTAASDFAYDKGYPTKDEGFAGKVVCGRAEFKGQLKKDGKEMWYCKAKFPFDYYVLSSASGEFLQSSYEKKDLEHRQSVTEGSVIEKKAYSGCPKFNKCQSSRYSFCLDNYDPFL